MGLCRTTPCSDPLLDPFDRPLECDPEEEERRKVDELGPAVKYPGCIEAYCIDERKIAGEDVEVLANGRLDTQQDCGEEELR